MFFVEVAFGCFDAWENLWGPKVDLYFSGNVKICEHLTDFLSIFCTRIMKVGRCEGKMSFGWKVQWENVGVILGRVPWQSVPYI